jgi:hypothetical protein
MAELVPLAINIPLPPNALFSSPHSCNQQKTPFSHSALFPSQLLQPTKNHPHTTLPSFPWSHYLLQVQHVPHPSSLLRKGRISSGLMKRRQSGGPFGLWLTHTLMIRNVWNKMKSKNMCLRNTHPSQVNKRCQGSGAQKHHHPSGNCCLQAPSSSLILIDRQ